MRRGTTRSVADRTGLLPALREAHIATQRTTFVDARGKAIARITPDQFTGSPEGRDVEPPRGDLARLLHEGIRDDVGFAFAGFSVDDSRGLDREIVVHNTPGRMAGCYAIRGRRGLTGMLAFATPPGFVFDPGDEAGQRELVAAAFAGGGWEVPRLVTAMRTADDFFFDSVSQIRMPRWSAGRVALVGDAGYAPALLSAQGTSLALVGG